ITREDVARAAGGRAPDIPTAARVPSVTPGHVIPVTGVRARIAERMTLSRSTIPEASCSVEANCARLLDVRRALREAATARVGADVLTPFALILRLVVSALAETPILNATYEETGQDGAAIRVRDAIHLGIGVDTDRGLLVPVVRDA